MSAITSPGAAILVTGANGFIGGHLCEHLVAGRRAGARAGALFAATRDLAGRPRHQPD
ncbi:MAG: hypothetical protein IPO15_17705 [Anaerolineae bacterium]|uniref:NAD-dependent epimerase/dehydratase family protein n=1 Tax=Candidatus Amarolinea dominans TaxID=3140696 RepID=UPI0031361F4E|nr:hypothetical protein [Anaerolineae bacterium]